MRIGVSCPIDRIRTVERLGFDYMESTIVPVAVMTDEQYEKTKAEVLSCTIRMPAFNAIFPGTLKLTGPDADDAVIAGYLEKAVPRLAGLGCGILVFGSGKSRTYPEGWDKAEAIRQMERAVRKTGEICARHGITVVIEPLNHLESNIVTTVTEGYEMSRRIGMPNVLLLADFYHMRLDGEDFASVVACGPIIRHTHIANMAGRRFPLNRDEDLYDGFFEALAQAKYAGGVSIEGSTDDFERDCETALKLLKSVSAEHGL